MLLSRVLEQMCHEEEKEEVEDDNKKSGKEKIPRGNFITHFYLTLNWPKTDLIRHRPCDTHWIDANINAGHFSKRMKIAFCVTVYERIEWICNFLLFPCQTIQKCLILYCRRYYKYTTELHFIYRYFLERLMSNLKCIKKREKILSLKRKYDKFMQVVFVVGVIVLCLLERSIKFIR